VALSSVIFVIAEIEHGAANTFYISVHQVNAALANRFQAWNTSRSNNWRPGKQTLDWRETESFGNAEK